MLVARNLQYGFSKAGAPVRWILNDLSLTVAPLENIGIIGANGSGKSTLLRVLATLEAPRSGEILWQGVPVWRQLRQYRSVLAYTEGGNLGFYPRLSGLDNLRLFLSLARVREETEKMLHISESLGLKRSELLQNVATYSLGMRQMLHTSLSLLKAKPITLMDEPTNGLSSESVNRLSLALNAPGQGSRLIVSHDRAFLESVCSRLVRMHDGKLEAVDG